MAVNCSSSPSPPRLAVWLVCSVGDFLPWYEWMGLKRVCRTWKDTVDEAFEDHKSLKLVLDYLNEENRLHTCVRCHLPLLNDGTGDEVCCSSSNAPCGGRRCCNGRVDVKEEANHRARTLLCWSQCQSSADPRLSLSFKSLSLQEQVKRLYLFHAHALMVLKDTYLTKFHRYLHNHHQLADTYENDDMLGPVRQLFEFNHDAYHLVCEALVAEELHRRLSYDVNAILHHNCINHVGERDFNHVCLTSLRDSFVDSILDNDLEEHLEFCIVDEYDTTEATSLLGPTLAARIDLFQEVRDVLKGGGPNDVFPLAYMPCFDDYSMYDDEDFDDDDESDNSGEYDSDNDDEDDDARVVAVLSLFFIAAAMEQQDRENDASSIRSVGSNDDVVEDIRELFDDLEVADFNGVATE